MEELREYLKTLTPDEQRDFAKRAGTSIGYLRKCLSTGQKIGGVIARRLDEESNSAVRKESLRYDIFGGLCSGAEDAE